MSDNIAIRTLLLYYYIIKGYELLLNLSAQRRKLATSFFAEGGQYLNDGRRDSIVYII